MCAIVPDTAINEVGSMVDDRLASAVLHGDFHKLLEDWVVAVVPILEFVIVGLNVCWNFGHTNQ